jgi:hypothetical protein
MVAFTAPASTSAGPPAAGVAAAVAVPGTVVAVAGAEDAAAVGVAAAAEVEAPLGPQPATHSASATGAVARKRRDIRHRIAAAAHRLLALLGLTPLRPSVRGALLALVVFAATLASLILRARVPIVFFNSDYDDLLFMRSARHLAAGQWLGPFDKLTLVKGPAYPMFIAATNQAGLPLKLAEQATYLVACGVLALTLFVLLRRPVVAAAAYCFLALDPINDGLINAVVQRDGWYASLSLLVFGLSVLTLAAIVQRYRIRWTIVLALLSGLALGVFWLCREEGIWIAPALVVLLGGAMVMGSADSDRTGPRRERLRRRFGWPRAAWLIGAGMAAVGVAVVVGPVIWTDRSTYGASVTNDLTGGAFAQAYSDWTTVRSGPLLDRVPLSRAQLAAAFEVSPSARQLQPALDDPGNPWAAASCRTYHVCGQFSGAYTVWALRDAAAAARHFTSEAEVQTYFTSVDSELEAACSAGRLTCAGRTPPSLQPLQRASVGDLLWSTARLGADLLVSTDYFDFETATTPVAPGADDIVRGISADRLSGAVGAGAPVPVGRYRQLAAVYTIAIPVGVVVAIAGVVVGLCRRTRRGLVPLFELALLTGIVVRLVFVATLDTTQYSVAGPARYQLPAHTLLVTFTVVGSALLADIAASERWPARVRGRFSRRRPDPA